MKKSAPATKSATKAKVAAQPEGTTTHRVIAATEQLRDSIREGRLARGIGNRDYIQLALSQELEDLTAILSTLGFVGEKGTETRPLRVELETADVAELNRLSAELGLPAVMLLKLCLSRMASRPLPLAETPKTARNSEKPAQLPKTPVKATSPKAKTAKGSKKGAK